MQLVPPTPSRLRPLALALGAAGALAVPSAASAGTLTVDHGAHTAAYQAAPGEVNAVSILRDDDVYVIRDKSVGSMSLSELGGSRCAMEDVKEYTCPVRSVATASISLGDGADTFSTGSSVPVTLTAGPGVKNIKTGSGDDVIAARNGSADQIVCGAGSDRVEADVVDTVDPSCEQVDLTTPSSAGTDVPGTGSATGDPGGNSSDAGTPGTDGAQDVFETPVGLTVAVTTLPLSGSRAHVQLACASDAATDCRGDVTLELPLAAKKRATGKARAARGQYVAQQRRRGRRIGKRTYRIRVGEKKTIAVPVLLRSHYSLVSRRRRIRAVMRITERNAAGKVFDVQTRSVTLDPASKRGQR
jgi:hypothetical protein